jgi:hypothetical protein
LAWLSADAQVDLAARSAAVLDDLARGGVTAPTGNGNLPLT